MLPQLSCFTLALWSAHRPPCRYRLCRQSVLLALTQYAPMQPDKRCRCSAHSMNMDSSSRSVLMQSTSCPWLLCSTVRRQSSPCRVSWTYASAFDMTNPDGEVAARAKEDFTQCCAWLRHFSSMWPAASAHKLFFEAGKQSMQHRFMLLSI
jgi:hypothetical protein